MAPTAAERPLSEIIRERRATPSFDSSPVPEEDLKKILQAGLEAPSGYNLQPWRFVVVRDPAQRKRLREAAMGQSKVEEAPVVIVACGDPGGWRDDLEPVLQLGAEHGFNDPKRIEQTRQVISGFRGSPAGNAGGVGPDWNVWINRHVMIAFTTVMWMAEALGYDTAPMEGFFEDKVREVLGIPPLVRVVALLAIGRRKGPDKPHGGRFPVARLCFDNAWNRPLKIGK
jgi:nitroreductase